MIYFRGENAQADELLDRLAVKDAEIEKLKTKLADLEAWREMLEQHVIDLAVFLPPPEATGEDGTVYIFKDPDPERTLRGLQAALYRALDLAMVLTNKRVVSNMAKKKGLEPNG